jgi:beta-lactamase regulating signal transducer with metallopeptidase domain/predicted  nucleic acid-binding Zn-ribbon protein
MFTGSFAGQAVAWMLTYLLHSTLLLGLAWLASKPLSRWSVAAEEMVWKLALVGALFTASLQLAAGWQPLAGQWRLADLGGTAAVMVPSEPVGAGLVPARVGEGSAFTIESHAVRARIENRTALPAAPTRSLPSAAALALGAWALGALVLLAAFGRSYLRLSHRLRSRPRVVGGDLHGQLRTLAAEAGLEGAVRLSCSCRVPVPLALGFREPEICVPPRALVGLTEEQQEGMLAHELAHLARRDPFWLVLGQGLACVLFFQPLNWVARRRLREISEMLSDEWAVARTGRPLSLAGCLAEVAGWSVGVSSLPVPSMADRPSSLGRRIRRLLDESRLPESPSRRAWLAAAMGVLVIAVAAAAPAVSAARPEAPLQPKKPAAPHVEVDVNDATDAPTARAAAEEDRHHGRHEEHDRARKDRDAAFEDEEDGEPDVHVDIDADEISEQVTDSVQAALDGLDGELEALSEQHELTQAQQEKLARDMAKMSRDLQRNLNPRLEKLSHELAEKATRMAPSAEMQRLTQEMGRLGEQMRPSEEEMARLQAMVDQEVRKHGSDEKLTREERERIRHQAREMAEKMKPTEEQRRKMEELRSQLEAERAKMGESFKAENREEIERLQREIHQEVEREMQGVREELRRVMDERKAIEKQDRKDRRNHRHDARPDHDRDDDDGDGDGHHPSSGC